MLLDVYRSSIVDPTFMLWYTDLKMFLGSEKSGLYENMQSYQLMNESFVENYSFVFYFNKKIGKTLSYK